MRFFARSKAKNGRLGVEVTPFGASVAWLAGPEGSADGRGRCECAAFEGTDLVVLAASVREWATGIGGASGAGWGAHCCQCSHHGGQVRRAPLSCTPLFTTSILWNVRKEWVTTISTRR